MKKLDPFIFILVKYKKSRKTALWSRMFIQTEETPNPLTLKFLPGQVVMLEGTRFFEDLKQSHVSPLVEDLFMLEGVDAVLLGADFVSVTKKPDVSWESLRPFVFTALMEHFLSRRPLFREEPLTPLVTSGDKDPLSLKIEELLETRIRPAVAADGGDILFDRFEEGIVYVHLRGACAGCPSSTATLKGGIENMLRHYVPEVEEVRAV